MPKKTKIASPVKALKGQEKKYQRQLNKLGRALIKAVNEELLPYLKAQQPAYVADNIPEDILSKINSKFVKDALVTDAEQEVLINSLLHDSRDALANTYFLDGVAPQLSTIFRRLNQQFTGTIAASFAAQTSARMVGAVNEKNQARLGRSIESATGVNLSGVVAQEGLEDFLELQISKNVSLINSLPEEYLKQVEVIVNNGVLNGSRYSTIAKEITAKTGSANRKLAGRIKTIAMNEVQTINAQMTQRRTQALGISEGIYRTAEDEKVRPCHKELNGVRYELSKGAWSKTCQRWIIPGVTDINCRCSFSPVIEVPETPREVAKKKAEVAKKVEEEKKMSKKIESKSEVIKQVSGKLNKKYQSVINSSVRNAPKTFKGFNVTSKGFLNPEQIHGIAFVSPDDKKIHLNKKLFGKNGSAEEVLLSANKRMKRLSVPTIEGTINHEFGHLKWLELASEKDSFQAIFPDILDDIFEKYDSPNDFWKKLSISAQYNQGEFFSEYYSAVKAGLKIDPEIKEIANRIIKETLKTTESIALK